MTSFLIGTGTDKFYAAKITDQGQIEYESETACGKGSTWILADELDKKNNHQRAIVVNEHIDKIQIFISKAGENNNNKWEEVFSCSAEGETPCYLQFHPKNKNLISCANYNSNFVLFNLDREKNQLSKVFTGDNKDGKVGPQQDRQEKSHPHMSIFEPQNGNFMLIPDLGTDSIHLLLIKDAKSETPKFDFKKDVFRGANNEGYGPRHITFHPTLHNVLYIANELASKVTVCQWRESENNGDISFEERETVNTLPAGHSSFNYGGSRSAIVTDESAPHPDFGVKQNTCASINISPCGQYLFVSNRGRDSLTCFEIDVEGKTGALKRRVGVELPCVGRTPRFFTFTPCGKFLMICNQDSDTIAVHDVSKFDFHTGAFPFPICVLRDVPSPQCIAFL